MSNCKCACCQGDIDIYGNPIRNMELEDENQDLRDMAKYNFDTLTEANAQLVAGNKRLREALEEIAKETEVYFNGGGLGESLFIIAKQALEQSDEKH